MSGKIVLVNDNLENEVLHNMYVLYCDWRLFLFKVEKCIASFYILSVR